MSRRQSPCQQAAKVRGLPNWSVARILRSDGKRSDTYFCLSSGSGEKRTFRSLKELADAGFDSKTIESLSDAAQQTRSVAKSPRPAASPSKPKRSSTSESIKSPPRRVAIRPSRPKRSSSGSVERPTSVERRVHLPKKADRTPFCPKSTYERFDLPTLTLYLGELGWDLRKRPLPSLEEVASSVAKTLERMKGERSNLKRKDPKRIASKERRDRIRYWVCALTNNWDVVEKAYATSTLPTSNAKIRPTIQIGEAGDIDLSLLAETCPPEKLGPLARLCTRYTDAPESLDWDERERRLAALEAAVADKLGTTTPKEWLKKYENRADDPLLETAFREIDRLWFDGQLAPMLRKLHVVLRLKFKRFKDSKKDGDSGVCSKNGCEVTIKISPEHTMLLPFKKNSGYECDGVVVRTPVQAVLAVFEHELVHLLTEVCRCEWAKSYAGQPWSYVGKKGQTRKPDNVMPPRPWSDFEWEHEANADGHGPMFCRLVEGMFGHLEVSHNLNAERLLDLDDG